MLPLAQRALIKPMPMAMQPLNSQLMCEVLGAQLSAFTDGCDLTPTYHVRATRDISECGNLNKGLNHQTVNQQTRNSGVSVKA